MTSRLVDFLLTLALITLACSGTALMAYAVWRIGQDVMRAMHTLLTCWNFHTQRDDARERLTSDPVMRDILAMSSPFQRIFAPFFGYARDLRRLSAYRYQKAQEQTAQMIWDTRLGALLTRDELDFLYGKDEPPAAASLTVPVQPVQPTGVVVTAAP
jgi:hypothetical protein